MRTTKSEIVAFAEKNNFLFRDSNNFIGDWDLEECLPISEQDRYTEEVNSMDLDERGESMLLLSYFNEWDSDYVNGFCSSVIDRVIVGMYMAHNCAFELEVECS